MSINLTSYASIQSHLCVRIQVDQYKATSGDSFTSQTLLFSDSRSNITIGGETYLPLGNLMGITTTTSEIRASGDQLTITISGIPDTSIAEIVNSRFKGSSVKVYRMLFNAATGTQLAITGNPVGRFFGIVNNYSLQEEYDVTTRVSSNTIVIVCSSSVEILSNKVAGRRTNPQDQKGFYASDTSMDRVPNLVGASFNFGAP
jgi:hypothetical protein